MSKQPETTRPQSARGGKPAGGTKPAATSGTKPAATAGNRAAAPGATTRPQSSTAPGTSTRTTVRPATSGRSARKVPAKSSPLLAVLGVVGVLVVAVLIIFLLQNGIGGGSGGITAADGVTTFSNLSRSHVDTSVTYDQVPPVGGPHNAIWLNCGVYDQPQKNEQAVHALEHGAIWITYQPDLPADQVQKLRDLTKQSGYRLLSPYPGIPSPVVATAWGYQIKLDSADDPRLMKFITTYEQNPNGPEPGAACSGGVGSPIQ